MEIIDSWFLWETQDTYSILRGQLATFSFPSSFPLGDTRVLEKQASPCGETFESVLSLISFMVGKTTTKPSYFPCRRSIKPLSLCAGLFKTRRVSLGWNRSDMMYDVMKRSLASLSVSAQRVGRKTWRKSVAWWTRHAAKAAEMSANSSYIFKPSSNLSIYLQNTL